MFLRRKKKSSKQKQGLWHLEYLSLPSAASSGPESNSHSVGIHVKLLFSGKQAVYAIAIIPGN